MKLGVVKGLVSILFFVSLNVAYSQQSVSQREKALSVSLSSRFNYFQHSPLGLDGGIGVNYTQGFNPKFSVMFGLGYEQFGGYRRDLQVFVDQDVSAQLSYLNRKITLNGLSQSVKFLYTIASAGEGRSKLNLSLGFANNYIMSVSETHDRLYQFDDGPDVFVSDQVIDVSSYYQQNMLTMSLGLSLKVPMQERSLGISANYETSFSQMSLVGFSIPQHAGSIYPKSLVISIFYTIKQFN